jgi:threonine dehydrogenase-like Zn-dependent dehydrogenase
LGLRLFPFSGAAYADRPLVERSSVLTEFVSHGVDISADQLPGRAAVVTGAAQGIGLAIAQTLSRHGATVVIADIDGAAARAAHNCSAGRCPRMKT